MWAASTRGISSPSGLNSLPPKTKCSPAQTAWVSLEGEDLNNLSKLIVNWAVSYFCWQTEIRWSPPTIHSSVMETVHPALLDQSRKTMNAFGGNAHLPHPHPHTRSRVLPPVAELIQPLRWISHASLDASDVGAGTGRRPHLFQEDSSPGRLWRRVLRSREWRRKVVINFKLKDFFLSGWLSLWRLFRWDGEWIAAEAWDPHSSWKPSEMKR